MTILILFLWITIESECKYMVFFNTTKIIAFLYIQKEIGYDDWEIIEDKMVVINNYYGGASITCDDPEKVEHGHNYRLRVSGYAYKGTSYTGEVVYSDVKYYP